MDKNRIEWIDILKGVLLAFIVVNHNEYLPQALIFIAVPTNAVWVPCFFLLSGMLFSAKKYPDFNSYFISKVKTLLVPYLVFFVIFVILDWNLYLHPASFLKEAGMDLLKGRGPSKASPLWFVSILFVLSLLYYILNKVFTNDYVKLFFLFVLSFVGFACSMYNVVLPFHLDVALSSALFFGLGHLAKSQINSGLVYFSAQKWLGLALAIVLMLISRVADFYNHDAVLSVNRLHNYPLFYITAFSGIFSIILLTSLAWNLFADNIVIAKIFDAFRYIALAALPILACHCYILILVEIVFKVAFKNFIPSLEFICSVIVLIISLYYIVVPFCFNKLYFLLGTKKRAWNESLISK